MCKVVSEQDYLDTLQITSELLDKRAERKAVTSSQINQLLKLDSPLKNQYERASRCAEVLFLKEHQETGERKLTANYCGKRFCSVCSAIKTAEMMKGYYKPISQLNDIHFVTLTVPAVKADKVKSTIKWMKKVFTRVKDSMRKAGQPISGIRKVECNYNPEADTFNPHFHLIIEGRINSIEIVDNWLKRVTGAVIEAQDVRKADDTTLKELFKYSVKSVVGKRFYPEAQDVIYRALSGTRTFQNFGDVKKEPVTADKTLPEGEHQIEDDSLASGHWRTVETYHWSSDSNNWISWHGEIMYQPVIRSKVQKMIKHIRDG